MILSFCSGLFYLTNFGVQTAGSISHRPRHTTLDTLAEPFKVHLTFPSVFELRGWAECLKPWFRVQNRSMAALLLWECFLVVGLCAGAWRQMQGEPFLQGFTTGCTMFGRENGNGEFCHPITNMCPSHFLFPSLRIFLSEIPGKPRSFCHQTALSFELNCNY